MTPLQAVQDKFKKLKLHHSSQAESKQITEHVPMELDPLIELDPINEIAPLNIEDINKDNSDLTNLDDPVPPIVLAQKRLVFGRTSNNFFDQLMHLESGKIKSTSVQKVVQALQDEASQENRSSNLNDRFQKVEQQQYEKRKEALAAKRAARAAAHAQNPNGAHSARRLF